MTPDQVFEQAKLSVRFARNLSRRRRVLARGRLPLGRRFPVPRAGDGDRRGRHDDQHPGHRGLRGSRALRQLHRDAARAHPELRQGGLVGALPQRPRHGGGQFAGRRQDRRRAPGRVHHQRPRRACRQLLARRGGDGGAHAARLLRPRARHRHHADRAGVAAWSARPPASSCSRTRRWSAPTPLRTPPASTRTACSKARDTYEIMRAEDVGWAANKIVLGKLSGRNAFKQRLQELGIAMESEADINAAFARFKDLADRKSDIFDEDILALVSDESVTRRARALPAAGAERSTARPASARTPSVTFADRRREFVAAERWQRPGRRQPEGHRDRRCRRVPKCCCTRSMPSRRAAPSRRAK